MLQQPIVERPLIFKFQCADRMRDAFERIFQRMRVGVHRINAPFVAGAVMMAAFDAVQNRIAQIDIGRAHIDFCAQHQGTICVLSVAHFAKQREIFRDASIAMWRIGAAFSERAAMFANFVGSQTIDIGKSFFDQAFGKLIHPIEVIRGVVEIVLARARVLEAEPMDAVDNGIDIFLLFFFRVCIVKTQMAAAAVIVGEAEVKADRLGVADV